MSGEHEEVSRRAVLGRLGKAGVIAGGAVWVAPAVLTVDRAGAAPVGSAPPTTTTSTTSSTSTSSTSTSSTSAPANSTTTAPTSTSTTSPTSTSTTTPASTTSTTGLSTGSSLAGGQLPGGVAPESTERAPSTTSGGVTSPAGVIPTQVTRSGGLPFTGAQVETAAAVGGALVVAGVTLMGEDRRRRRQVGPVGPDRDPAEGA